MATEIQQLVKQFKVTDKFIEVSAWKKRLSFTYKGKEYGASLFWDEHDGYELMWSNNKTPAWARDWDWNESLEYVLDCVANEKVRV